MNPFLIKIRVLTLLWTIGHQLLRGANRDDTGMYAFSSAFLHSHKLRRKNSQ